jgi:hypothetical protein
MFFLAGIIRDGMFRAFKKLIRTSHPTDMNLIPRLSSLAATMLCAFTFLFVATTAPAVAAKKEKVVGKLETENGVSIRVNGKTTGNGGELKCGDVLETASESVKVAFASGLEYVIDAGTKVRLACTPNGKVTLVVIYGGVHPVGVEHDPLPDLPWLAAFGNANASFPSTGGGFPAATGKIPIYVGGTVVGFALTNSFGQVVAYTDPSGKLLASFPPNGKPVSSVFGQGATI